MILADSTGLSIPKLRHVSAKILRQDFASFIAGAFATVNPGTPFLPNWHIDLIAEYLNACAQGEIQRLIVNVPPRSLKSLITSVAWPGFLLGHNAARRIIVASYAQSLATKHALDARLLVQAPWYQAVFPHTRISREQNEKHKFLTTRRGFRLATSVGGSVTGEGGDFLIVDDPLNPTQALSAHYREAANIWFDQTFCSRLDHKEKGVIVVVMQRLHEHDLSGHVLEKPSHWEHVCLPAIAENPTHVHFRAVEYWRAQGDILHPARESEALIRRAQEELGSYAFAAQYQQSPLPERGGMVDRGWLQRYDALPEAFLRIIQSWDTAIKAQQHHDCSACVTIGETAAGYYLLDVLTLRAEYPELKRRVVEHAARWRPELILMEDKASGQSLLQELRQETPLPLKAVLPKLDKISRFAAVSALIEAGKVFLPQESPWLAGFEQELLRFPNAMHDDQVDALTHALHWLRHRHGEGVRIRMV